MKKNTTKYIALTILFIVFIAVRINHILLENYIDDISFKSLAIAKSSFPFGIIKNTVMMDYFSPIYYLLIHFFTYIKNCDVIIRIFNIILSFLCVFVFVLIGKKLKNEKLGIFLGLLVCLNHFFLFYTNLISPYCLTFIVSVVLIKYLIDFLKRPGKKNYKKLNILNCCLIVCDSIGFIYVACELFILYLFFSKKQKPAKFIAKLSLYSFICFLFVFLIYIIQYARYSLLLIPETLNGTGFSLSGFYLLINEFITPYLSFISPEYQTKSTLGLMYSFFLNPAFNNLNTLKILLVLFYSSILPLAVIFIMSAKACLKDYKLKILCLISLLNLFVIILASMFEKIALEPIYLIQFFITMIILLGYGIFSIKDKFFRYLIIFCMLLIQVLNTELNSFNVTVQKKYAVLNPVKIFFKDYEITHDDLIIMPYMGEYAKLYFKNINFFNFSYSMLQKKSKDNIIKNLSSKKAKTINKNNICYLLREYLLDKSIDSFLTKYFIENCININDLDKRIVLVVDKLNSKPVSINSIAKSAVMKDYSPSLRKIDFRYVNLEQNKSKIFFNALESKTLYNFIELLSSNFYLESIVEYKKIDNEYYKLKFSSKNIFKAITSFESDYVFIIFHR